MYLISFKGKTCPKIGHLPPDQFHEKFHKRLKNNKVCDFFCENESRDADAVHK